MKATYDEAMAQVYEDEGGYSNDAGDSGGPTNFGITIHDARMYWKPNATAADVRAMPKSVAAGIYAKHYAEPIRYDDLPPGVDYAVLDYGINSGIGRVVPTLQRIVGVPIDGKVGPTTINACYKKDSSEIVNAIYDQRLTYLKALSIWSIFGKGWGKRCANGRKLALSMVSKYPKVLPTSSIPHATAVVVAGGAATAAYPHLAQFIIPITVIVALATYFLIKRYKGKQ